MSEAAVVASLQEKNTTLQNENHRYRTKLREFKAKVAEQDKEIVKLREEVKPKDGTVVLSGGDVKEWEAFKAIGKKAAEVTEALTKGEEARGKLAGLEWEQGARKAAQAAGITNADAFLLLPGVRDLTFEVRTEKEDGKDVERVLYKGKEGEAKTLSREAIEGRADWKPLAPALFAEAAEENGRSAQQQTQGIPFSRQRSERKGGETKKSDEDYRKAVTSTTNYGL